MDDSFIRTEMLIGEDGIKSLENAKIAVFGIGGVGGYVVEALSRSKVGTLDLIDGDKIEYSNINRQIIARHSTIGMYKVDAAKERVLDINPKARVNVRKMFYTPDTSPEFDMSDYDYIIDAVDMVTAKLAIVQEAVKADVPVISSMGFANKMDPSLIKIADISDTSVCPLAKVMRRELKKRGIERLKVAFSTEKPIKPEGPMNMANKGDSGDDNSKRKKVLGSNAFVPAAAGIMIAGYVVRDIIGWEEQNSNDGK